MTNRGKRRTLSQRIGEKGEALYRSWAVDNCLTSQKVEQDYGIDFFSQILKPIGRDLEEITGGVLAVQVKSVEGMRRKRIKIFKTDAENAMRLQVPFCLVAIDISEKKVYHRFLNEDFFNDLIKFVHSENQSLTIGINSFSHGSENFQTDLGLVSAQGYQYRLRILKAESNIVSDIPGTTVNLIQGKKFGMAKVSLPWVTQAFSVCGDYQDEAAEFVFEKGILPPFNHPNIRLRQVFDELANIAAGPILLQGVFEEERNFFVEYQGKRAVAPFNLRRIGDERAYIGESGLVLIISDPRNIGGLPAHRLSVRFNRDEATPLLECSKSRTFLGMLMPKSILNEEGKKGIPISSWPNLEGIGAAVSAIYSIAENLKVKLQDAVLTDFTEEEFGKGISLLNAIQSGIGIERLVPPFISGPGRNQPYKEDNWEKTGFRIPLALNIKRQGIVLWVTGRGSVYIAGDPPLICGFRAEAQESWELEHFEYRLPVGPNPTAWIHTKWPGIPVMPPAETFEKGLTVKGPIQNPIGGEFWPI